MHYARYRAQGLPIGSGVTEAACKTLVKQRLCGSGMKWVERDACRTESPRTGIDQRTMATILGQEINTAFYWLYN